MHVVLAPNQLELPHSPGLLPLLAVTALWYHGCMCLSAVRHGQGRLKFEQDPCVRNTGYAA